VTLHIVCVCVRVCVCVCVTLTLTRAALTPGIPAAVACPVSCGTCGIGLCYVNGKFKSCKLSTYSTDETDVES
jgi:hypothetical protein